MTNLWGLNSSRRGVSSSKTHSYYFVNWVIFLLNSSDQFPNKNLDDRTTFQLGKLYEGNSLYFNHDNEHHHLFILS